MYVLNIFNIHILHLHMGGSETRRSTSDKFGWSFTFIMLETHQLPLQRTCLKSVQARFYLREFSLIRPNPSNSLLQLILLSSQLRRGLHVHLLLIMRVSGVGVVGFPVNNGGKTWLVCFPSDVEALKQEGNGRRREDESERRS